MRPIRCYRHFHNGAYPPSRGCRAASSLAHSPCAAAELPNPPTPPAAAAAGGGGGGKEPVIPAPVLLMPPLLPVIAVAALGVAAAVVAVSPVRHVLPKLLNDLPEGLPMGQLTAPGLSVLLPVGIGV